MAGTRNPWEENYGSNDGQDTGGKPWEQAYQQPEAPKSRTLGAVANDTVIEVANAAAGGVSAAANFVKPGNAVSGWIDKNIVKAGEDSQSDVTKAAKQKFRDEVENADGVMGELGAVGKYVVQNPLLSAAQAGGSFVGPGLAVKAAGFAGKAAQLGAKGVERAGRAGGVAAGAAMAGGDAAGTAYELSKNAGATDDQAVDAGRQASVIPAIVGGVSGMFGAERLLAGAKGFAGGAASRALKTGASEAAQEGLEEGVTQYEGQRAAMPYDASIDPSKGVAAAAGMGTALGGITGAGTSLLAGRGPQPDAQPAPAQDEFTTSPGAADPNAPSGPQATPPEAPDLTTSPGAGVARDGMDFTRDVDTSGLSLQDPAELARQRAATVDYQPGDTTPQWDTQPGAAAPRTGLDMPAPEFDTTGIGLDPIRQMVKQAADAGGALSAAAGVALDVAASNAQFIGATGRELQPRRTGPGVTNESNVIDVQGRVIEDPAIGTPRRLTDQQDGMAARALGGDIAAQPPANRGSVPALPAPTNLRDAIARIRAQKQEAANAQATAPQAAPASAPVPAAGTGAVEAAGMKPAGQRQLSADEQAAQDREEARAKEPSLPPVLSARLQEAHKAHGRDVKRSVVERSIANEKANNTGTPKAKRERADRIARLEADLALFDEAAAMPPKEAAGLTENKVGRKDSAQIAQPESVVGEVQRSAAPSAITPTTTQGTTDAPQAAQAQQASPQPAQAGAAPAAAAAPGQAGPAAPAGASTIRALSDGAPTANPGAQAAPASGAQGATAAEPEFTTIKTVYGDSVTVRTADLNSDKPRLRQYTKDGKSKVVPAIHRDNLDLIGDKRAAIAKEDADNPFFNVIATKDGSTFANQAAASRELNRLSMGETHEVVAASEVQDGVQGFVIRRKLAEAMGGRVEAGANQAEAPTQQAQAATENVAKEALPSVNRFVVKDDIIGARIEWQALNRAGNWEVQTTFDNMEAAIASVASSGIDPASVSVWDSAWNAKAKRFTPAKKREAAAEQGLVDQDGYNKLLADHEQTMAEAAAPTPAKAPETPAKASGKKKPSADQTRAKADLMAALADLGDILGKNTRMNITPEQEVKLLPVLTRVLDAAFRLGYHKFKDAAKFALDQIRANLGDEAADALTLDHLQGAYIAMAGGKEGVDTKRAVISVESKEEIEAHEAVTVDDDQVTTAAERTLTQTLRDELAANRMPKDNPALKKLVEAFDGKPADQARMKQAQEALEAAIVQEARARVEKLDKEGPRTTFASLVRLYESQPLLNVRTSTSIANQAYSTPAPLAYLASKLAGITPQTLVHEPTGGTGMLLIGVDPKNAVVNELNDLRVSLLKEQGFEPTQKDASIGPMRDARGPVDAVITNPPFGSVKGEDGKPVKVKVDGYNIGQIDHLIAAHALATMKDDGRAVLILGANKAPGGLSTDDRIFFNWLYSHYNVVGHFEVEGDLYARQGAGWPVRVIVINGREQSAKLSPVAGTIQRADNWDQVYEQFNQILGSSRRPVRGAGDAAGRASDSQARPAGVPGNAGAETAGSGGRVATAGADSAGNVAGAGAGTVADRTGATTDPVGHIPDEQRLNGQSFVPPGLVEARPGADAPASRPAKPVGTTAVAAAPAAAGNEFQTPYVPRSARKDEGVLIPSNMAQPTQDALNRLEDAVGDIDEFARKELGYESTEALHNALMGLQVDSVATAIYQIKQGKAAVIADQTGIGKGRQAASIIRWAARNGMTPVFVSVKPSLFTDMYGDLADIGTHDVAPFILNSAEWVSGADGEKLFTNKPSTHRSAIQSIVDNAALPQGRNALFMTYSQINTANLQRQALMALAPNAVFVLDESHNAAGDSGTGDFMISVLKEARGVTYLSATYAKRPDNMPLYFKTDIGDAAADSEGLANAMAAGGLPLQTVVSNNLVKAGQMFRRERSYDGVSIASTFDTANRQLHERLSDEATEALRAIVSADKMFHSVFVKSMDKALKAEGSKVQDNAGNQVSAGVQHTEFSSVVHNFVRQMLLGLKAQTAADEAIASLKRGEKPIIAVENTMGSFLSEYAAQNNINQGDSLGAFDYRTVLSRALERSRVINVVLPTGDKSKQNIPLSQLDPMTRKAYDHAQEVIDRLAIDIPVSPIDWMRAEISRAGFSVAEITGRDLAVDYSNPRKPVLSAIDLTEQRDKVASTRRFNGGELDALILNVAGSTGISLHASEKFADQRQRHMIVAQAAGDINIFMQMLGRVHRTGQVRLPKYTILSVDLPTEKRPTAVLSRKMKSLNANTSSNTESATSVKTADILNKYGDQIVNQYLVDNLELAHQLDVDDLLSSDGERVTDDIARKATGRLALQPIEVQRAFYEDVEAQYDALIEYLNKTNQNDLEPRTFDFDAKEVRAEILFDGPNKTTPFGEDAVYGEYSIKAQGMAMKPEEIQAAIAEGLQGKTPAEHVSEMLANLDSQYKQFIEKLAEASREKAAVANADGEYDNTKHEAIGDTLFINKSIESAGLARQMGADFLRSHAIGKTFRVEINSEPYNAVITNVRSTHKTTGNPFSLSKIQITIAVNGALRSITVPATQFRKIEVSSIAPAFRIETLFKEQPANQRETAKIVTGNLLAAYGEIKGARGTIISFTKADGTIEQGILLPKLFDFSKNTQGDYRLRSGADALKFLQKSTNKDIGRFGIATRDGQVRVLPRGDGVQVRVPKSKAQGARYFLDKNLIAVAGDFVSSANAMVANVDDAASAKKVLDMLMDKQALYALPSMADEAKSMAAKPGADGGTASFSRAPSAAPSRADSNARNVATQLLVDGLKAKWTRAPEIIVARNMQDAQIPQAVRDYDAQLKSQGSDGEARGFIYKGKVYLLSDQLKGPQQIAEVLFHEVLGHYGLRGAFGDSLNSILQQMGTMRRRDVVAKAREYGLLDKDALGGLDKAAASDAQIWAAMSAKDRLSAAEEVLAEMAQTQPTIGFVQRAIAAIRNWLRANVPGFDKLALTDADIVQAYILPARGYVTRSQETGAQSLERAMRDAGFSRAPAGDQTQTEAFKRWFKDSKAVDSEGKPLVVYHGTGADFSEFSASKIGSAWGADTVGFFFTDSAKIASSYATSGGPTLQRDDGANIIPAYIRISRPVTVEELEAFTGESGLADAYESPIELMDERRDDIMSMLLGNEQDGWSIDKDSKPSVNNTHDGVIFSFGGSTLVVAVDPAQIKSAIGNRGTFDPTNPDIRFSRAASPSQPAAWDAPTPTGFDDVIYKLQDKNIDLKRVVEAITKSVGQVSDSINAYLKEELFHKRAAKRVADFGAHELKPLMNQMRLAGLSMEDVEEYLHARHAKEANAVLAERNPSQAMINTGRAKAAQEVTALAAKLDAATDKTQRSILQKALTNATKELNRWNIVVPYKGTEESRLMLSGMSDKAADSYFAKLDPAQRRKLESVAAKVDAIIADTRKLYVDYGLEDQAVVDGWASMYQHYIPLMREDKDGGMGTGQGFSVKGKETKGRTGSTRKVVDILANIASQRERLIVRGEKNRVTQALVGLAQANPNTEFWEVRSQAPTERVFDPKSGVVVERPDPLFKSRDNVVVAKVKDAKGNVTEQMVVFNEDNPRAVRMAAAMKNLDAGNLEGLLGVSAKITRYFSAINTQYNPVFGVVNLVRDVQGAMVNLAATPLAGQQGKIAKDTVSALLGIYGDIRKTRKDEQATSQWSQLWEQMQDDGGTTGYRELFTTSADRANNLKSILNPEGWMDNKWGKFFTANGTLRVPMSLAQKGATEIFGLLSDYNEAMENGVRLAAYKAALDKKMSREQAASIAKNLTVNFNRKGQVGQQAGAVYAFFNAAMQGTARIGQTLFDMDGGDISTLRLSKTGKAVVYGGVLLGVMQALALAAASFDAEDPPEFVRERSLIIPTGGKTYMSIPMPLGLHVIPGIGRHAVEFALSGFDKPAQRAVSVVGMFADAFNPIGNAGLSMQTIAPTALDPLVALTENKDWTGKPIARVSSNKALPGHTQWKDTATGFSKVVAEAINWVSGGNEYVAGAFSPTPDQIDYLIAQLGGGVAREAAKVQQTVSSTLSGEELPTYKVPLVGRFVGNAASQASQGSAFYANLNKLNELETEIKGLRKDGKFEEASQLIRQNPQAIMIAMANRAERDVQRLRREKRELIAKDASREEVRAKEEQITSVMTRLNEAAERRKALATQ